MIVLTGHLGYVGPILTKRLSEEKYEWKGFDSGLFVDPSQYDLKDIRDISEEDLKGAKVIVHLASLSNDPLGEVDPALTEEINFHETIRLAKLAKKAGVKKFIFFSSCSVYGMVDDPNEIVNEDSAKRPLTAYADSKLKAEQGLIELEDENFYPICFRFGTVYGVSPHMRSDLVINNLMGTGFFNKKIEMLSDGTPWRPLIHLEDMVNAVLAFIQADKPKHRVYNIGQNKENYQMKDLAQMVGDVVGDYSIEILGKPGADNRSYRVDFLRFYEEFGEILRWNVKKGCEQVHEWLKQGHVDSLEEYFGPEFVRIKKLKQSLERK